MDDSRHAARRRLGDLREILQHAETHYRDAARAKAIVERYLDDLELWLEEVEFDDDSQQCTRCFRKRTPPPPRTE